EPGIGKSTLTLQICDKISENLNKIIYISGEESASQISSRAKRLNIKSDKIYLVNEVNLENIFKTIEQNEPSLIIIDSIQVIYSENLNSNAGSISQVRFCTEQLMNFAKKNKIPIILIGHVTKEGQLAGPRVLEHLVDTVLNFEGDRYQHFRILRAIKNRFGSTQEAGVFEMTEQGLQEINNPSGLFLEEKIENSFGTCLTCAIEGNRAFLLEVQALTNTTPFGYPKRASSGFDVNRLQLLIAVLQKHANLNLSNQDVYINVVSGFKLKEPAADLAVCLAIISSFKKTILPPNTLAIGEIGLTGEIRTPNFIEKRIQEAQKFKIPKIFGPVVKGKKFKNYIEVKSIKEISGYL
ncbi:DNA repair protein RadA, partial [Candidatus Peregrinibacteria bacterium RIFOXYC2_FULL_33_13]